MPRPWWLRPLSPDFIAVPHEPSAAERAAQRYDAPAVVRLVDSWLRRQSQLEADDRNDELVDALLAIRSLLTVPVTPGRSA